MATVRVTRSLSQNSAFGREIANLTAKQTAKRFQQVADLAVQNANAIVSAELVNDRPPDRRKTGRHLLGSFVGKVIWNGSGFPVVVQLSSLAESGKVASIEKGAKPHDIVAKSGFLVFPVAQRFGPGKKGSSGKFSAAYAKGTTILTPAVRHPGNKAYAPMRRGLERAVQQVYHRSITLQKR